MDTYIIWLIKIILAHLLTDFVLQPGSWIESRKQRHFASIHLYLHGLVTALVALLFLGYSYWLVVLVIFITHILIDGWKSYQPAETKYFLIDQALHLLVILVCWYFSFLHWEDLTAAWEELTTKKMIVLVTAFVFLTTPSAIMIGQFTKKWRDQIPDEPTLGNAGKWIGILERILILSLVLHNQYGAIGLLIAAKGLLRFSEPNRAEIKTEYLVIGTLISISLAVLTGMLTIKLVALQL